MTTEKINNAYDKSINEDYPEKDLQRNSAKKVQNHSFLQAPPSYRNVISISPNRCVIQNARRDQQAVQYISIPVANALPIQKTQMTQIFAPQAIIPSPQETNVQNIQELIKVQNKVYYDKIDILTIENLKLNDQLNEKLREIKDIRAINQEMIVNLERSTNLINRLEEDKQKDKEKLKQITEMKDEEIKQLQQLLADSENEINIWKQNYDKAEKSYNQTTTNFQKLEEDQNKEIASLKKKIIGEQQQRAMTEEQNNILASEKQQFNLIIEDLESQINALHRTQTQSSATKQQDIYYYESEFATLRTNLKECRDQLALQESINQENRMKILQQNEEINFYRQRLNEADSAGYIMKDMEQKILFLQQENQRLNGILVGRCREMRNNW